MAGEIWIGLHIRDALSRMPPLDDAYPVGHLAMVMSSLVIDDMHEKERRRGRSAESNAKPISLNGA
jgi:hypothetical protein